LKFSVHHVFLQICALVDIEIRPSEPLHFSVLQLFAEKSPSRDQQQMVGGSPLLDDSTPALYLSVIWMQTLPKRASDCPSFPDADF
jgi:hypothetical protein